MACDEFTLISRYFSRDTVNRSDVDMGPGDDCALLIPPAGQLLAISTDTLVEGTHFLADIQPADLGYKALAVNLSDLAAMGAEPAWLTLALTLPHIDEPWLQAFSDSLFSLLDVFTMQLIGGDTTRGPRSMTLSVHGWLPAGQALRRGGARPGDHIYVTGTLGDSAAGLALLQQRWQLADPTVRDFLIKRHLRPQPRVAQGLALRGLASAAIDLSDGLLADLGHILQASQCGARLNTEALPLSSELQTHGSADQVLRWALSGGEDYELCFTVPASKQMELEAVLQPLGTPWRRIGEIVPTAGLQLLTAGQSVTVDYRGFNHFNPG